MPKWNLSAVIGGMKVGDSFFIPCLQCDENRKEIRRIAALFDIDVDIRPRTEEYIRGLRTWRIR
jgi:hypothetical protein